MDVPARVALESSPRQNCLPRPASLFCSVHGLLVQCVFAACLFGWLAGELAAVLSCVGGFYFAFASPFLLLVAPQESIARSGHGAFKRRNITKTFGEWKQGHGSQRLRVTGHSALLLPPKKQLEANQRRHAMKPAGNLTGFLEGDRPWVPICVSIFLTGSQNQPATGFHCSFRRPSETPGFWLYLLFGFT